MFDPLFSFSNIKLLFSLFLSRFCAAMLSIRAEAEEIRQGQVSKEKNLLKCAPHPIEIITRSEENWDREYSRERAAYPVKGLREAKFWPSVARLDEAYGDTHREYLELDEACISLFTDYPESSSFSILHLQSCANVLRSKK